jgi:hypothetical protein
LASTTLRIVLSPARQPPPWTMNSVGAFTEPIGM